MNTLQVETQEMRKGWSAIWWIVLLQGLIALGFGLYMLADPQSSIQLIVQIFALFIIIDGILEMIGSFLQRKYISGWGWRLLGGGLVVIAGLVFWAYAGFISSTTIAILIWIVAIGLLISGLVTLFEALRGHKTNPWSAILWAAVKLFFAGLLMTQTGATATVLLWIFGAFLFLSGIFAIILAFQLRSMLHELEDADAVVIEGTFEN